jgi:predicted DCC family thiol-disulfide oxidoreductase YuxK
VKPLLIFDGDCGFCRKWIARWRSWTKDRVSYAPYQETASRFPQIDPKAFQDAVHLVEEGGKVSRAAEAVFRSLAYSPRLRWPLWLYLHIPGFRRISETVYAFVASHRVFSSWVTYLLWGEHLEPPTYNVARRLFLRSLGAIFLIAFISLWVQLDGLMGSHGILPASELLAWARERIGADAYWVFPSIAWLNADDWFLHTLCGTGVALSILLIAGLAPAICCLALWAIYLSLCSVGQDFFSFQWDILLLETALLAAFLAPWKLRPRGEATPALGAYLARLLLFKLMFSSGMAKLASGDATWRNLSALTFHYETQPLPTWIGWWAHQLPVWMQKFSCALMFFIELVVPFFFFFPRNPRLVACGLTVLLMILILLTGNYTFFNLLAIALCLFLVDDAVMPRALKRPAPTSQAPAVQRWALVAFAVFAILTTWVNVGRFFAWVPIPRFIVTMARAADISRSFNHYGLFSVMTTRREEIVLEGSNDGTTWAPYEFKWKPGDPAHAPGFVEPHQPRLDWQMWFQVFGPPENSLWYDRLVGHLLKGTPEVLGLLGKNPFPDKPPKFVRGMRYHYRFTDWSARSRDGAWWTREELGVYSKPESIGL